EGGVRFALCPRRAVRLPLAIPTAPLREIPVMRSARLSALTLLVTVLSVPTHADVDTARIIAADAPENAGQWLSHGRDYSEQRYSPLARITADNVGELSLAWYGDLAERGGSYETTPIVVD